MDQQDHILTELRQLSLAIAEISRENVFRVPDGYFDMLSNEILLQVQFPISNVTSTNFRQSVPEGYFESLADNILAKIKAGAQNDANEETHTISPVVAGIGNRNIFTVPAGYFGRLPDQIMASFPGLSVNAETATISTLVAGIGNSNVYAVPAGYFHTSASTMLKAVKQPARVVSMGSRFTAFRYAAAAVVTGLIGLSVFFFLNKDTTVQSNAQTAAVLTEAKQILKTNSFDQELSAIPDAAIVSYLESKGQDVEAALVASLTDDKNLPEAEDYILNDNTLDEVLKTIDLNN